MDPLETVPETMAIGQQQQQQQLVFSERKEEEEAELPTNQSTERKLTELGLKYM